MSQEQIVVDVQPIATEALESMEAPLREVITPDPFGDLRARYPEKEDLYNLANELMSDNTLLSQANDEHWREISNLDQEVAEQKHHIEEIEQQLEFRNKALAVGGGIAGAISIAGILGYVKERKVHKQIVALIEETAIQLAAEEIQSDFISFNELVSHVSLRLSEFEVRSFRRPFAIPAKELERTTDLLIGMLRTAETLAMQYANLETANTIDVEGKE